MNNSLLLDPDYQEMIRESINEITTINAEANPNTLWGLIKGAVRNETIKYASKKKKATNKTEDKLNDDITKLKKDMSEACNFERIEIIKSDLERKINELESILENKINGSILRSKANIVEYSERNSKYFASLERKRSESKLINRLLIKTTTN